MAKRVTKLPAALVTRHILVYAINTNNQLVVSRFKDQIAWPILDGKAVNNHRLEVRQFDSLSPEEILNLNWTKNIPYDIKNTHRLFWGLEPVAPGSRRARHMYPA